MVALTDHKTVGLPFRNGSEIVRVEYDFANDTGATADYDVLTAGGSILVEYIGCDVSTALTSGTDFDIDLGKAAGGTEYWSDNAKAVYALDAQVVATVPVVELASGEKIVMGLGTAAATAGKMTMIFRVYAR